MAKTQKPQQTTTVGGRNVAPEIPQPKSTPNDKPKPSKSTEPQE